LVNLTSVSSLFEFSFPIPGGLIANQRALAYRAVVVCAPHLGFKS
jgi:hypothetical protein